MKGRLLAGSIAAILAASAAFIAPWEGRSLTPYADVIGVLTVCNGHTGGVENRTYTPAECDALLRDDTAIAYATVTRCIASPMTQGEAVALTSATFNIGPKVVCGSTLQRKANAGDWAGACAELDRWVNAAGKRLAGLVRRRSAERVTCEGGA